MSGVNNGECQKIIGQLHTYIKKYAPHKEARLLQIFSERYYLSCAYEDLKEREIADLYAIVWSHWNFIAKRAAGESKVKIFNPQKEKDGWDCVHTVIQISHDDIPFLVDSARMVINRYGYQIHFIVHFGGLKVKRNAEHRITELFSLNVIEKEMTSEAPIYIEIDNIASEKGREELQADIERVLGDARVAVADWRLMAARVEDSLAELDQNPPSLDVAELAESRDFLRWLINNNFTFLGSRDYKLIGSGTSRALQMIPGSGFGVLREDTLSTSKSYAALPPQARKMALSKNILIIAKTNTKSTVHRDAYTDYIGVKRFDSEGNLIGERRFIGLYTSTAYHSSPRQIPFLRHKVDKILQDLGFPPDSHDGKEAVHILETLPRDDLFQATHEELLELTLSIIQLKERKRVRLLVRRDAFYRYFSCLVYIPYEVVNTELAFAIQEILVQSFKGIESHFTTYLSDSVLARIHFLIRVNPKTQVQYDVAEIEKKLKELARTFSDKLKEQLINYYGEARGLSYYQQYNKAFPTSYTEYYSPLETLGDIEKIATLSNECPLNMSFSQAENQPVFNLKLFHAEHTIALSDVLPILENMGLRIIAERPYQIKFKTGHHVWINDFDMTYAGNRSIVVNDIKDNFQEAFTKIWFT